MTKTFGYVSLIRATRDNPEWGDEAGDISLMAGKVPDPYMPVVPDPENNTVSGRRYDRLELVELPRRMKSEEAFEWAHENGPERVQEWYDGDESEVQDE